MGEKMMNRMIINEVEEMEVKEAFVEDVSSVEENNGIIEEECTSTQLVDNMDFDKEAVKHRSGQLIELMEFDPENKTIYRNELVELNIRLVPHVLKKYKPFGDDEFQAGCVGLIKAANSFKSSRGVPFANYACFCIERELHKMHEIKCGTFEYQMGYDLFSMDETLDLGEDKVNKHEQVADALAEETLEHLIQDYDMETFFERVIIPAVDAVATNNRGQKGKIDVEYWKELEVRYIAEMAREDSQKARMTLSWMAKELGASVQNVKVKHQRVMEVAKALCIKFEYYV